MFENTHLKVSTFFRAFFLAIIAACILFICTALTKSPISFGIVEIIRTMATVSVLAILALEIWDTYVDSAYVIRHITPHFGGYSTNVFGGIGSFPGNAIKNLFVAGLTMVFCIAIVSLFAGGYSIPVVITGLVIGTYLWLPATGDDYWLLAMWIGCVITCLATGTMSFSELIDYQTFGPFMQYVGGMF